MGKQRKRIAKLKARLEKKSAVEKFAAMTDNEVASSIRRAGTDFLSSYEWRSLKAKVHAVYGYRCMCCGFDPKDRRKSNVDHIKPRRFFPELALDFDNLQVLCGRCNKAKGNNHMTDYRPKHPLGLPYAQTKARR